MAIANEDQVETHVQTYVYRKDGITYVPHYRNPNVYVGPGYPMFNTTRYAEHDLLSAGAERHVVALWPRSQYGIVTEEKP